MNKKDLSIATISWARNPSEESLLRRSLTQLALLGIPVFITDGGSQNSFLEFLESFPHFTVLRPKTKGLWAQAKNSLTEAGRSNTPFIFYTEPDKFDFFSKHLPEMLARISPDERCGIWMASRSEKGFASFPSFQQMTETTINKCCAEVMGQLMDYTYGPFLLNRDLVQHLEHLPEDIGWGWRPYAFNMARRLGYTIEHSVEDFFCPADQRDDDPEERKYRMRQLNQNIQGLLLSGTTPLYTGNDK
jgi:hypothetical protein